MYVSKLPLRARLLEMPLPFVTIAAVTAADYSMSLLCCVPLQGPDETPQHYESFTFPSQLAVHSAFNLSEYAWPG